MAQCKGCGAEIKFIKTVGMDIVKLMPCNAQEKTIITEDGNVVKGWEPHWRTCTHAHEFRKPKTKEG